MTDIGPNLASLLGPVVLLVVYLVKSTFDAKRQSAERERTAREQNEQLNSIHKSVNGNLSAVKAQVVDLKSSLSDMLAAQGPAEQATADAAGQKSLES